MNIHEQIIALLNGEMTDETQVSELMHVLAVSPEKRGLLVEQVRMTRAFQNMATDIAPSRAADAGLWERIAAFDAALPARAPAPPSPTAGTPAPVPSGFRAGTLGLFATLLVGAGIGVGYMMFGGDASTAVAESTPRPAAVQATVAPGLGDSLRMLDARFSELNGRYDLAVLEIEKLRNRPAPKPEIRYVTIRVPVPAEPAATAPATAMETEHIATMDEETPAYALARRDDALPVIRPQELPVSMNAPGLDADEMRVERDPRFQVGLRNNLRYAVTKVYGQNRQNTLTDRELYLSMKLSGEGSPLSNLKLGVAGGQTEYSFIAHSNTGQAVTDTIFKLTRLLWYGRGYVAPQLFTWEELDLSGALELGAGGTQIGPIGTVGFNLEYIPSDFISVNVGVSAWQIWTQIRNQTNTSMNLNAHWGAAFRF